MKSVSAAPNEPKYYSGKFLHLIESEHCQYYFNKALFLPGLHR